MDGAETRNTDSDCSKYVLSISLVCGHISSPGLELCIQIL